jgi:hypothetical protein
MLSSEDMAIPRKCQRLKLPGNRSVNGRVSNYFFLSNVGHSVFELTRIHNLGQIRRVNGFRIGLPFMSESSSCYRGAVSPMNQIRPRIRNQTTHSRSVLLASENAFLYHFFAYHAVTREPHACCKPFRRGSHCCEKEYLRAHPMSLVSVSPAPSDQGVSSQSPGPHHWVPTGKQSVSVTLVHKRVDVLRLFKPRSRG